VSQAPESPPPLTGRDADARRLRTGYLRLKSALYDQVTGLCTFHALIDQLETHTAGRRLGVLVLEFPTLGQIEVAHGWEASDRFLLGVASHLKALRGRGLPSGSLVTLDGVFGHTFPIFLLEGAGGAEVTGADLASAASTLAAHLESRLRSAPWAPPPPPAVFTVGYALVAAHATARYERLVHQGIREARGMAVGESERLQMERADEFRLILKEERLTTHYQPIVDMQDDTVLGYEALTRGPLNTSFEVPDALFACSETIRLSGELDALCRRQAVRNARGIAPDKMLFVNTLPETLAAPGFIDPVLERLLDELALAPRNLVLEITERSAIDDFESFGRAIERLRRRGFLIAIDDVGTGHSSLQRISEIHADFLKIDISLIKNIHRSLIKQDLVQSLLHIASRARTRVIAEGIETVEECRTLGACGVRYGQGFYFAPPAPPFPVLVRGGRGSA
jgi:EAL domain-containing protein (putative c-di-GMP-specific phosphodiesterase class I)/GGDEF domain-containing protein